MSGHSFIRLKPVRLKPVRLTLTSLLLAGLVLALWPAGVRGAEDSRFFPETGQTVSGKFLEYWNRNGGLAVYGFPITPAQMERDPETGNFYLTQWFERNRFELHPELAGTPYEVLLGLLGKDLRREALEVDPDFQPAGARFDPARPASEQNYFRETGHNLRGGFLKYWQTNGGLERFGFPISEERQEVDPQTGRTFTMQWFERARFEYHPENRPPYDILLGLLGNQLKRPPNQHEFVWKIGGGYEQFFRPAGLTADADGQLFVADALNQRLLKFRQGRLEAVWGGPGQAAGQFDFGTVQPAGLTADGQGGVYVADTFNRRVQHFDGQGRFLEQWGGGGLAGGQFSQPSGLARDRTGHLYVLDKGNGLLHKFTGDGRFLTAWGSPEGFFAGAVGLAIDGQDNLYVLEQAKERVLKYDTAGRFLLSWDGQGRFQAALAIAAEDAGRVFVADKGGQRVIVFDRQGNYLDRWGEPGQGDGQFDLPLALAADRQGSVYVGDYFNNRVQQFTTAGSLVGQTGRAFNAGGVFHPDLYGGPSDIAVNTRQQRLYVADVGNRLIQKFDNAGRFLNAWGGAGAGEGRFGGDTGVPGAPMYLATDPVGNVFVSDPGNYRVQKFDSEGRFLKAWGSRGADNGQFGQHGSPGGPAGIAADLQGNIYVGDRGNGRVQKFDNDGRFLKAWGRPGLGDGLFADLTDLAVDPRGFVYVADGFRVQKFDLEGQYLGQFGNGGTGLAVDNQGNVYVSNLQETEVWRFDKEGHYFIDLGGPGTGNGLFAQPGPGGLAVDAQGNIFVADPRNNRIQKFRQPYWPGPN